MGKITLYSEFPVGDMLLQYYQNDGLMEMGLIPAAMKDQVADHRKELPPVATFLKLYYLDPAAFDSLVQFKLRQDGASGGHYAGSTMRSTQSSTRAQLVSQTSDASGVTTTLRHPDGMELLHRAEFCGNCVAVSVTAVNKGEKAQVLEYLGSFSLGMISPFQKDSAVGKYLYYRAHSTWATEGRLECRHVEEANLEMSWQAAGLRTLRYGQNGGSPVRGFFPFAALQDTEFNVTWGAQLQVSGSWEMEISRSSDFMHLSGGKPGWDNGQWSMELQPGESYTSCRSIISCAAGGVNEVCARLVKYQHNPEIASSFEADLPVMFNEFCTSWGRPYPEFLDQELASLKGSPVKYFVLDDGWFKAEDAPYTLGDWVEADSRYPEGGFGAYIEKIRKAGFIPGVWFEFENAFTSSVLFKEHPDWFLTLNGQTLIGGVRAFLDFRKPEVIEYLKVKVIEMLKKFGIGYMKVDYNASNPGLCDGPFAPAENFARHMAKVCDFYRLIKQELPELVLEVCASGGHRLTPEWMRLCDMASFSDAHEGVEIPLVAANVQRMIPAYKSQVWVTVRPEHSLKHLYYLCCNGFMGRFCLSGDMSQQSAEQREIIDQALDFYPGIRDIIWNGESKIELNNWNNSFSEPTGWQLVRRNTASQELLILHTFGAAEKELTIPTGYSKIVRVFAPGNVKVLQKAGSIVLSDLEDFAGLAILLEK